MKKKNEMKKKKKLKLKRWETAGVGLLDACAVAAAYEFFSSLG